MHKNPYLTILLTFSSGSIKTSFTSYHLRGHCCVWRCHTDFKAQTECQESGADSRQRCDIWWTTLWWGQDSFSYVFSPKWNPFLSRAGLEKPFMTLISSRLDYCTLCWHFPVFPSPSLAGAEQLPEELPPDIGTITDPGPFWIKA